MSHISHHIWIDNKEVELAEVRAVVGGLKQENSKGKVVITADAASDLQLVRQVVKQLMARYHGAERQSALTAFRKCSE